MFKSYGTPIIVLDLLKVRLCAVSTKYSGVCGGGCHARLAGANLAAGNVAVGPINSAHKQC